MKQHEKLQPMALATSSYHHENLIQAAWASLRFDRNDLLTTRKEAIRIHNPGTLNTNQGPDFLDADIQIGDHRHHGHVELHLNADDWVRHGHHRDPQYNGVVLHVFLFKGKRRNTRIDGTEIPELYLGDRVGTALDVTTSVKLPCSGTGRMYLPADPQKWMTEAGHHRLLEKSERMGMILRKIDHDWSQLLWEELAGALGGPINAPHFKELALRVPWSLARRHNYSCEALEALLFGSCGMLEGQPIDPYQASLQEQWRYMQTKHSLVPRPIPFKFHRMHPAGFPTVRIAQFAALAARYRPIIAMLEEREIRRFSKEPFPTSEYWAYRYEFGNTLNQRKSEFGAESRQRIVMNVLVPLLQLYGSNHGMPPCQETLYALMRDIPAENNKIVRKFADIGLQPQNALESQGLLCIEQHFCRQRRCKDCEIGSKIPGINPQLQLGS